MEDLLYYVWQYRLFTLEPLETTDHLPIEIIDTGLRNLNAGPDFFNAKIKIGNTLWVGNIEMHQKSSDWYRHKHNTNTFYDSVILHVVDNCDTKVYRTSGDEIPQLVLLYPKSIHERFSSLSVTDFRPKCFSSVLELDKFTIHSWLSALQIERLELKQSRIITLFDSRKYLWSDILFITLARNFGFGLNGDVFEFWAKNLPFRSLDKHRDGLLQIEAFFYGMAGLLNFESQEKYVQRLQEEYIFLKNKFGITTRAYPWQLAKIRPGSFPHIRIAQLAWLYHRGEGLLQSLIEADSPEKIQALFSMETSAYWTTHYSFGKESPSRKKQLGKKAKDLLMINTVVPFIYAYGKHRGDNLLMERALDLLNSIKPENNYIMRIWEHAGVEAQSAADSQALIQLQKEYCDKRKCLYCRFGYYYLTHKRS